MVTVFTPTFNRFYIIGKLYNSLCMQTSLDFEWLVVDDGSTDETELFFQAITNECNFPIRYIRQKNGGKHRAINRGVQEAKGELFFIVDSDDQLVNNAIERILFFYAQLQCEPEFAGVCGVKAYFSGEKVGGEVDFDFLDCNSLDFRYKYRMKGDMAEVFCTAVLKDFPFPEIEGELFCPEAVVWNRIAMKYKLRYFNEKIYLCDYLPDGLTAKIVKIRMKSPEASKICYSELFVRPIPFVQKLKAAINYWRFSLCSKASFKENVKQIGVFSLCMYPIALLFHLKDLRS